MGRRDGSDRLRVLVVTPDFPPARGGIQLLVHRLVSHWHRVDACVLTLRADGSGAVDSALPAPVRRVPARLPAAGSPSVPDRRWVGRSVQAAAAVGLLDAAAVGQAVRFRPHVVLSAHVVTAPAAALVRRLLGIPYVQYVYAKELLDRAWLSRLALTRASAVVTLSRFGTELAVRHGARGATLHQIPCGVDAPPPPTAARSRTPLLVTVSRLADEHKGHDVVLRALPEILRRVPGVTWTVIGDGPLLPRLRSMAETLGVGRHVTFAGELPDPERDRWLDRAHVFVMPSRVSPCGRGDGFGIAYLEAAAHGLPVVAGNAGGALAAVDDQATGLLVDPTDPAAVADAVVGLLADPGRAREMGRAGAARARRYSWAATAAAVESLLEEVSR